MKTPDVPAAFLVMALFFVMPASFSVDKFDEYLAGFTYQERKDMKIESKELVELLQKNEAQLIDIRFPEEVAAWRMGFAKNIPLNELPSRLGELDKNKLIVTACPHNDRSHIARMYLTTKGYRVRYLHDGLIGLAELLRGDTARDFVTTPAQ